MSDLNLVIKVEDQDLANRIRRFGLSVVDLSHSMDEIGTYLDDFFASEVFASRGRIIGEPWAALNARYAAWKARAYPGRPPLVRTGLMQRSFRHNSTRLSVSLYNEAEYFTFHQEGVGVPARVMAKVDDARAARIVQMIEADINGKIEAARV